MKLPATTILLLAVVLPGMVLTAQAPAEAATVLPPGVDPARWKKLDLEAKWVTYQKSLLLADASKQKWVVWLRGAREFELLEWMAVFGGWNDPFTTGSPGLALALEDAPQWIRVALWNLKSGDSHNQSAAEQALLAHPEEVWGWLEKYPKAKPAAQKILATFKALTQQTGLEPGDPGDALPPLDPVTLVLPYLDAPRELPEMGDLTRAKRSGRYLHQVLRGLAGVASGSLWGEPYRGKTLRLTRHPHARVRQAAFLTFTKFPKQEVPYQELLSMFQDTDGRSEDRRHALLALSYSEHPAANLLLHDVVLDPEHPCWDVACSRLGDVGNQFTLKLVGSRMGGNLSAAQRQALERRREQLGQRKINWSTELRPMLERAAWAQLQKKAYAKELVHWTRDEIRAHNTKGGLRSMLQGTATGYVPPKVMVAHGDQLSRLVRGWAKGLALVRAK